MSAVQPRLSCVPLRAQSKQLLCASTPGGGASESLYACSLTSYHRPDVCSSPCSAPPVTAALMRLSVPTTSTPQIMDPSLPHRSYGTTNAGLTLSPVLFMFQLHPRTNAIAHPHLQTCHASSSANAGTKRRRSRQGPPWSPATNLWPLPVAHAPRAAPTYRFMATVPASDACGDGPP